MSFPIPFLFTHISNVIVSSVPHAITWGLGLCEKRIAPLKCECKNGFMEILAKFFSFSSVCSFYLLLWWFSWFEFQFKENCMALRSWELSDKTEKALISSFSPNHISSSLSCDWNSFHVLFFPFHVKTETCFAAHLFVAHKVGCMQYSVCIVLCRVYCTIFRHHFIPCHNFWFINLC